MKQILIVTTSHSVFDGPNPHPTGVWLEEFAVPYMEFLQQGMALTVASPTGGAMPVDPRSSPTKEQEQVWKTAIEASKTTRKLSEIKAADYDAVFLPGGHGPMFDLPDNSELQLLLQQFDYSGKIISSVCHGPAGLVGVTRADGTPLVAGKTVTCYTTAEEVLAKLDKEVPFLLEDKLRELGADFVAAPPRADHVQRDGNLITGQNPQSSQSIAKAVVEALQTVSS